MHFNNHIWSRKERPALGTRIVFIHQPELILKIGHMSWIGRRFLASQRYRNFAFAGCESVRTLNNAGLQRTH